MKEEILIKNAGLVLLNSFIPILFEKLNLTKKKKFLNITSQSAAVNNLQYLAAGSVTKNESGAELSKALCGMDIHTPITAKHDITRADKQLMDALIKTAISHWTVIGKTSVAGFRGNWLVRDGQFSVQEDKWELTVQSRPFDMLINQSPFLFSIIKHPWMEKPLHVTWPF
jgi:hypothetical protein